MNREGRMQSIFRIEQNDPAEKSDTIDSYRRLMINLLKIYQTQEQNKQFFQLIMFPLIFF